MLLVPWMAGFAGLGVGMAVVGFESWWLFAFAYIPVALFYVVVLLR